ncbi:MAG: FAD-dependent oxidoreductase [Bacteroidota bacterium]
MAHLTTKELSATPTDGMTVDIVIVGAGVSGLYAAHQLLKEGKKNEKGEQPNICILEQLGRTGGRLDSSNIEFPKNRSSIKSVCQDDKKDTYIVKEEQGGMRFTFDTMDNLMALIQELGLEDSVVPFPMSSGGNNRLYFRGEPFTNQSSTENDYEIWSKLYNLAPQEQGINPKGIINTIFNRILSVNPHFTERPIHRGADFWQRFRLNCRWKDIPLIDWQMQGLFNDMGYSNEVINLLYRLIGFNGIFLSNVNVGVGYQLLEDFPSDPKFKTFKNGFSQLINRLAERVSDRMVANKKSKKDQIFLRTMVNRIEKNDNDEEKKNTKKANRTKQKGKYIIHYTHVDDNGDKLPGRIYADKIILALPRAALEKLFISSDVFNSVGTQTSSRLWNTLQTTVNYPLLKINLFYRKAWWSSQLTGRPPVDYGPNFSDLPLGSVYPFYVVSQDIATALEYARWWRANHPGEALPSKVQEILDCKFNAPAALTIYCDYMNINFWKALQNQGNDFKSDMQKAHPQLTPASKAVVRRATQFFRQLFNTHYVPEPVLTSARIWSASNYFPTKAELKAEAEAKVDAKADPNTTYQPYGYAVHFWGMGANDKKVMEDMVKPVADQGIYTCNESYSDYQGWVEGSLRSTNRVLQHCDFNANTIIQDYTSAHDEQLPDVGIKKTYWANYVRAIKEKFGVDLSNYPNPYLDEVEKNPPVGRSQMRYGEFIGEQPAGGGQQQMVQPGFGQDLSYFD